MATETQGTDNGAAYPLNAYAVSLDRDLTSVLFVHAPGRFTADAVRNAARVMAVGVLARKLHGLIAAAPPGDRKGGRIRLEHLATEILTGRMDGSVLVASPGAVQAPEGQKE